MKYFSRRAWLVSCGVLLVVACKRETGPIEPVWGKQPCSHCKMILSDQQAAAQLLTSDGTRYHFDDIGCMLSFVAEEKVSGAHVWVHDVAPGRWQDAATAHYRGGAKTPMDYGFLPEPRGKLTLEQVRQAVLAKREGRP